MVFLKTSKKQTCACPQRTHGSSRTEVSIIDTSPDFVQSLDFFLSRLISGFCLDQIKTRFESGRSLDKTQKYLSRLSPDWDLAPDLDLDWVWKKNLFFFRFVQTLSRPNLYLVLTNFVAQWKIKSRPSTDSKYFTQK